MSNGSYEKMRTEALASARSAGVDTRGAIADIATASTAIKGANRQPVVLALASADDVSAAVRPLRDAARPHPSPSSRRPMPSWGWRDRARRSPCRAGSRRTWLWTKPPRAWRSCATGRCSARVSCRGGTPMERAAAGGISRATEVRRRDDLAARLLDELTGFLTTVGADGSAVAQVSICGGLPELRTMTVPLMERLDVEVEALDSLFGIDVEHLPEPADEFREQAAALRLAWAAAADWRGPINLMRHRRRRNRRVALARAAVVAGVAAGLGTGWAIQQSAWWQRRRRQPVARRTPAATPPVTSPRRPTRETAATDSCRRRRPPGTAGPAGRCRERPRRRLLRPRSAAQRPASVQCDASAGTGTAAIGHGTAAGSGDGRRRERRRRAHHAAPAAAPAAAGPPPSARQRAAGGYATRGRSAASRRPSPAAATPPTVPPSAVRTTPPACAPAAAVPLPAGATASSPAATPPVPDRAARRHATRSRLEAASCHATAGSGEAADRHAVRDVGAQWRPHASRACGAQSCGASDHAPARQQPSATRPAQPATRRAEELPVPFDAVLGTILYSPDRKLAIVNGRIVGPGDVVNGARIVDITPAPFCFEMRRAGCAV